MTFLLAEALFNTFNTVKIFDGGPPPLFWVILIVNPNIMYFWISEIANMSKSFHNSYTSILETLMDIN